MAKKIVVDESQRGISLIKCKKGKHQKYNDGKPCKWCAKNKTENKP